MTRNAHEKQRHKRHSVLLPEHLFDSIRAIQEQRGDATVVDTMRSIITAGLAAHLQLKAEVLLQATIINTSDKTAEGELVYAVAIPWFEILREIQRDPDFIFRFANHPRKFEEFIAGAYERAGFKDVVLTPASGDKGRDIIVSANLPGIGQVQFVDELKAYSPGHVVTAKDVRSLSGVLMRDPAVTKGIITTTSEFAPGVLNEFKHLAPSRIELKDGKKLREWLFDIATNYRQSS